MEPWRSHMAEIAQYPNIFCKLSGMVTEADRKGWNKVEFLDIRP